MWKKETIPFLFVGKEWTKKGQYYNIGRVKFQSLKGFGFINALDYSGDKYELYYKGLEFWKGQIVLFQRERKIHKGKETFVAKKILAAKPSLRGMAARRYTEMPRCISWSLPGWNAGEIQDGALLLGNIHHQVQKTWCFFSNTLNRRMLQFHITDILQKKQEKERYEQYGPPKRPWWWGPEKKVKLDSPWDSGYYQ